MQRFNFIKEKLNKAITDTVNRRKEFVINPKTDFTRNRTLSFDECLRFMLSIGGQSINSELVSYYFERGISVSAAAYIQQRRKIKLEAFRNIFTNFNSSFSRFKTYNGYRLFAIDGCKIHIPYNPFDPQTSCFNGENKKIFNLLHMDAVYDLLNNFYVDAQIDGIANQNEGASLINLAENIDCKSIIIADRGYCTYNVLYTLQEKNQKYLIRSKSISSTGVLAGMGLAEDLPEDTFLSIRIKKSSKKKPIPVSKEEYCKKVSGATFSLLGANQEYLFKIRVIKFILPSGETEYLITNLTKEEFERKDLIELYNMRWGIETSFRDLKYSLGLLAFHSKKAEYAMQEVYAKLIMYNFSSFMVQAIEPHHKPTAKWKHKINFKIAVQICIYYFRCIANLPDIEELILKNVSPIRSSRTFERNKHRRDPIFFNYRIA